jgi:hypothetical protein
MNGHGVLEQLADFFLKTTEKSAFDNTTERKSAVLSR